MNFDNIEEANVAIQFLLQQRDNINNEYVKALVTSTRLQTQLNNTQMELETLKNTNNKNNKNASAHTPAREV